jgi:hypothetical protein
LFWSLSLPPSPLSAAFSAVIIWLILLFKACHGSQIS